jgi:hypothetical protein
MLHLEYIVSRLHSTSSWRQSMTVRYPHDKRNAAARDKLTALAKLSFDCVSPETKAKLAELSGPEFAAAVQMATREICFRCEPASHEDVAGRGAYVLEASAHGRRKSGAGEPPRSSCMIWICGLESGVTKTPGHPVVPRFVQRSGMGGSAPISGL